MTRMCVASVAVALGSAMLLLAPAEVVAKSGLGGLSAHHHAFGSGHHGAFRSRHHGAFRGRPLFGGYLTTTPYYGPDDIGEGPLRTFVASPEPPHALSCDRSEAMVTVPSEDGGTREIKVTRC